MVLPSFTYGCHIWGHRYKGRADQLIRLAGASIIPFMTNTPTKSLEMILNIKPMKILVEELSLNKFAASNTKVERVWHGLDRDGNKVGVFTDLTKKLNTTGIKIEEIFNCNTIENCHFPVDLKQKLMNPNEINIYTDGSKINEKVGYGFVILFRNKEVIHESGGLDKHNTVYRAELAAIVAARKKLETHLDMRKSVSG